MKFMPFLIIVPLAGAFFIALFGGRVKKLGGELMRHFQDLWKVKLDLLVVFVIRPLALLMKNLSAVA